MKPRTGALIAQLQKSTDKWVRHDRLRLVDHEGASIMEEPIVIRQALATRLLLRHVPLWVGEDEELVGCRPTMPFPEFTSESERVRVQHLGIGPETQFSHVVPGFTRVLEFGFGGLAAQAAEHLSACSPSTPEQVAFWKAARIACEGVVEYSARYAALLRQQAGQPDIGAARREHLLSLASLCERVPAGPATTFHEALQSLWFTYSVFRTVGPCQVPLGRLDQLLYPYWRRDLDRNLLDEERTLELLEQFYVKLNYADYIFGDWRDADNGTSITLGGILPDGSDAANELTYLCLWARVGLPVRTPTFSIRCHSRTSASLYRAAFAVLRHAPGALAFHNDEAVIPALESVGIERADAVNWACQGCVEPLVPGKTGDHMIGVWLELLKYLELALNNGEPILTGDHAPDQTKALLGFGAVMDTGDTCGPPTGDAEALDRGGFEALMAAYKAQLEYAIQRKARECNRVMSHISSICPTPLLSATFEECMLRGLDRTAGGCKYYYTGTACRGLPNVANALAAIRKLVYEERRISLPELVQALKKNFQGYEGLRTEIISRCPKFGNDDDYVDSLAREIASHCCDVILAQRNPYGFAFKPAFWASWYHAAGKQIGASADGRLSGAAIAANCSPAAGTATKGPTAVIRSVSKIDFSRAANGMALDLALPVSLLAVDQQELVEAMVRTYFSLGGMEIQFNLVDRETLRKAQADPASYRDLLVRVWGFSAFFVTLDRDIQDQIIARC
ncbi:MAG: pyruvate formate lyase family protein [Bacillota bacterium]|nr:pyruvate formate lyase family protein [Bacillota bacterium]